MKITIPLPFFILSLGAVAILSYFLTGVYFTKIIDKEIINQVNTELQCASYMSQSIKEDNKDVLISYVKGVITLHEALGISDKRKEKLDSLKKSISEYEY